MPCPVRCDTDRATDAEALAGAVKTYQPPETNVKRYNGSLVPHQLGQVGSLPPKSGANIQDGLTWLGCEEE